MAGKVSSNPNEFLLPDLGEGLESADLLEWVVKAGETVEAQQVLARMETAKAVVDLYSDRAGTIAELHGSAGESIKVGAPIVTFAATAGKQVDNSRKQQPARAEPDRASMETSEAEMHGENGSNGHNDDGRQDAGTVVGSLSGEDYSAVEGKVRAAPAVRRMARDMGVDIEAIAGTGIGGRVTMRDIETAAASGASRAPASTRRATARESLSDRMPPPRAGNASQPHAGAIRAGASIPAGQDTVRTPFKGVRRVIAERLSQSIHTAVHFTVMDEADITELDTLRRRLINATGEKLSYLPFVAAAVCRALGETEYARMNSIVDDQNQEIITHRSVHLGIATDTENGLMVPVIRNAAGLGVVQLSQQIALLASAARSRTIAREDLTGSTFTISNVGSLAGRFATPIINYPEVGILAVGRARDGVVVRNKMLGVGKILPLSLSCDHRVVDGGLAALLLARIIELLQSPDQLVPA